MTPTTVAPSTEPVLVTPTATPQRLISLDAFRGLTMALMVLVNNNGSEHDAYLQLRHSEWHGWTITDTVFPSFLWIVGVAITLSLGKRLAEGIPRARLLPQILRRAAILFVLGLAVYAFPHFNLGTQRILGVLQRIAICYLVTSVLFLYTGLRGQVCWLIGLLAAYWMLMTLVPVPGFGAGGLEVESNFAHYVDRMALGGHNYGPTKTWDPEGIVSTLPAIATTLFGVLAGRLLRLRRTLPERMTWLFLAGNFLLAAGAILSYWLPINKKLWTDSFCLFMAGLDFVVFAMFAWLVDGLGWHRPVRPLVILGMNAIAVYMVSEFAAETLSAIRWNSASGPISLQRYLYHALFVPLASPANASLLYSLAFTAAMYLVAYGMYRRGWFLRV
jgi:predicted acyltransferase